MDGAGDRVVDALGLVRDARRHRFHVDQNGSAFFADRRDLTGFEIVDERHHPRVDQVAADPDADEQERLENAQGRHNPERRAERAEIWHGLPYADQRPGAALPAISLIERQPSFAADLALSTVPRTFDSSRMKSSSLGSIWLRI